MKGAFRQNAIVALSCVITLVVWIAVRLLMIHFHYQSSTVGNYLFVILLYIAIRQGIKAVFALGERK